LRSAAAGGRHGRSANRLDVTPTTPEEEYAMRKWLSTAGAIALTAAFLVVIPLAPRADAVATNDDYADAVQVYGEFGTAEMASSLDATAEAGEPFGFTRSLWWKWTAPSSGTYAFDACQSDFSASVEVLAGPDFASLAEPAGSDWPFCYTNGGWYGSSYAQVFPAVAGTTYSIQVADFYDGAVGDVVLRWQKAPASNDAFADAQQLSGDTGDLSGVNFFATPDTDQPTILGSSLWFWWETSTPGDYMFDLCGTNFDAVMGIYTGETVSTLTEVAASDDSCSYGPQATFTAAAGTRYWVGVSGYSDSDQGDFDLHWQPADVPDNDDFADASPIGGIGEPTTDSVIGNNRFATLEATETFTYNPSNDSNSVWWAWTAPETGAYVLDTCGSNFETGLVVLSGTGVGTLSMETPWNAAGCQEASEGSMVLLDAVSGTTYFVRVSSAWAEPGGDILLRWQKGTAPPNDAFASATKLEGSGGTAFGTNMFATAEAGEPSYLGGHSVWWQWTAPSATPVSFDTQGSKLDRTALLVLTGSPGSFGTIASGYANASDDVESRVTFTPIAGQTYTIVVDGYDDNNAGILGGMGEIVLHWPASMVGDPAAPSITDHPDSLTVVAPATASFTATADGNPTPTVQWQWSYDGGSTWEDISGATSTTFTTPATSYAGMDGNQYRAVFTNGVGDPATTDAATLTVHTAPAVVTNPSSVQLTAGQTAELTASASGNPAPDPQWYVSTDGGSSWSPITGATSTTLTITSVDLSMDGNQYLAEFSNGIGSPVTTTPATLTVLPPAVVVSGVTGVFSQGQVQVSWTGATNSPTLFRCKLVKANAQWTEPCTSGQYLKGNAKYVEVQGYNAAGWGASATGAVTKGVKP
jgi:hypothetical protein